VLWEGFARAALIVDRRLGFCHNGLPTKSEGFLHLERHELDHKMDVVQSARFEEVLLNAIKRGNQQHLSEEFIRALYNDIHKESVYQQAQLRQKNKD
jgi:hypothetical protein